MTAKVFFGSIQQGRDAAFASLGAKLPKLFEHLDFSTIEKNDKVAIKMHLGFHDGYQTVPVFFVRRVVKAVKEVGGWPFITDNPTAVYNAVERGYTKETCGCPLIPIAGVKDGYTKSIEINFKNVKELDMGGVLHDADALIDLTHAKGHANCGYGGAIKNIALGGYSGPSRWNKIHGVENADPWWDARKCSPEHAQKLVKVCPYNALSYDKEKHQLKIARFACHVGNCTECLKADQNVGCLNLQGEQFEAFQEMMAITAKHILDTFDEKKCFFINVAIDITPHCDCMGIIQPAVVPHIGLVVSRDIVAVDQATLDLIAQKGLIESEIPRYFKHVNLDPNADLHPFARLWGPFKNPYLVTKHSEKLGLGSRKYELIEVLPPDKTMKMKPPKQEFERAPSFF
ncbi:MAG: DUF362 domain-containing protein [Candidatus Thorarchaeota archaeon]